MSLHRWVALAIAIAGVIAIAAGFYFFLQNLERVEAQASSGESVEELFDAFPELEEVWWFDNDLKGWQIYIEAVHPKTLHHLQPGQPYVFIVSGDVVVRGHRLTCRESRCLNIVSWK